jgi:hypothetical protein
LIIEENAAAAVDLQIYEAGGKEGTCREARLRPIGGRFVPRVEFNNSTIPDQQRGIGTPAVAIKNPVRQNDMSSD